MPGQPRWQGCTVPPFILHSLPRLLGPIPNFLDMTPLRAFIFNAGLGFDNNATVAMYLLVASVLIGALTNLDRILKRVRHLDTDGTRLFLFSFNLVLVLGALASVLRMACMGNDWAVKKTLYFVLPPLIVLFVYYLTFIVADARLKLRAATFSLAVVVFAAISILSLSRQWDFASLIITKRWGTLTTETVQQLKEVQSRPGTRVRLDLPILEFLQLVTIFDDSGHAIYAPFSSWRHGATVALAEADAETVYKLVHTSPEATRPSSTFFFSEVAPDAPTSRRYDMAFASNAQDLSTRVVGLDITFPITAVGVEPLMTSGFTGDGFFVYVEYLPEHMARIKFNYWGSSEVPSSQPFRLDDKLHRLKVVLRLGESVEVTLDGQNPIGAKVPVRVDQIHNTTLGENRIGGGLTTPKFTGKIAPGEEPIMRTEALEQRSMLPR